MNVWLSIDFDYFVREPRNWDHDEAHTDKVWERRFRAAQRKGRNLHREMDLDMFAQPTPWDFCTKIAALGYDLSRVRRICVADSHAWARDFFCDIITPEEAGVDRLLVHFDTHHDLGYAKHTHTMNKLTDYDCENWQIAVLKHYPTLRSKVVYPPWRGLDEMVRQSKWCGIDSISRRVTLGCYANEYVCLPPNYKVDGIFVCKSPSWTPPWMDIEFVAFIESLKMRTRKAEIIKPFTLEVEETDPMVVRPWADPV